MLIKGNKQNILRKSRLFKLFEGKKKQGSSMIFACNFYKMSVFYSLKTEFSFEINVLDNYITLKSL